MAIYTLPSSDVYKTGTFGTITNSDSAGSTVTRETASIEATTDDVGRIIMVTSGAAKGQYRRITERASAAAWRVESRWDVSPFRTLTNLTTDALDTQVTPAAGDTFVISSTPAEWAAAVNVISQAADSRDAIEIVTGTISQDIYRFINDFDRVQFTNNYVLYAEDVLFEYNYGHTSGNRPSFDIESDGYAVFGRQNLGDTADANVNGYPSHGCTLLDRTNATVNSFDRQNRGLWHWNGCYYKTARGFNSGSAFYGFYSDDTTQDAAQNFRMWGCTIDGNWGGRVSGDKTVIYQNNIINNIATRWISTLNPGIFQDNAVRGGRQVVYSYPAAAGDRTVQSFDIQDISTTVVNAVLTESPPDTTTTYLDWNLSDLVSITNSSTVLVDPDIAHSSTQKWNWAKSYNVAFTDATGGDLDTLSRIIYEDIDEAQTISTDDSTGQFPTEILSAYEATLTNSASSISNTAASNVATKLPHTWNKKTRNYNLVPGSTDLSGPSGPIDLTFPSSLDTNITETTIATVDGYTDLGTAARLYDYADKFKHESIALPTPGTQLFTKASDTLVSTSAYYHVTFDNTATDVVAWSATGASTAINLTNDTANAIDSGDFGIRATTDVTSTPPSDTDWTSYDNQYLHVNRGSIAESLAFLEAMKVGGSVKMVRTAANDATFPVLGKPEATSGTGAAILLGENTEANGTSAGVSPAVVSMQAITGLMTVKVPTTGYVGGISAEFGDITFDAQIQGEVVCNNILHSFAADSATAIIDTTEAISGTISLAGGSYTINNADVSGLTINRDAGETENVVVSLVGATGTPTLGANVELEIALVVTVEGGPSAGGNIYFFDSASTELEFSANTSVSTATVSSATDTEVAVDAVLTAVFTSPGYTDVIGTATLVVGTNNITLTTSEEGLPTVDAADYNAVFVSTYDDTDQLITVTVDGTDAPDDPEMTTPRTNFAINQLKDDAAYIRAVSDTDTVGILGSEGASGFGEATRGSIVFTPAGNASQALSFIRRLGSGLDSIVVNNTVTATPDGETEAVDFVFTVDIPTSPPVFDTGSIQAITDGQTLELKGSGDLDNTQVRNTVRSAVFGAAAAL